MHEINNLQRKKELAYIHIVLNKLCSPSAVATEIKASGTRSLVSGSHDIRGPNRSPSLTDVVRYALSTFSSIKGPFKGL